MEHQDDSFSPLPGTSSSIHGSKANYFELLEQNMDSGDDGSVVSTGESSSRLSLCNQVAHMNLNIESGELPTETSQTLLEESHSESNDNRTISTGLVTGGPSVSQDLNVVLEDNVEVAASSSSAGDREAFGRNTTWSINPGNEQGLTPTPNVAALVQDDITPQTLTPVYNESTSPSSRRVSIITSLNSESTSRRIHRSTSLPGIPAQWRAAMGDDLALEIVRWLNGTNMRRLEELMVRRDGMRRVTSGVSEGAINASVKRNVYQSKKLEPPIDVEPCCICLV